MEKHMHKMKSQSWEEKQFVDSNDTQAKSSGKKSIEKQMKSQKKSGEKEMT